MKKMVLVFIVIMALLTGCNPILPQDPIFPPNPEINPENSIVEYIRVYPPCGCPVITVEKNKEVPIIVRGYNSEDEWVILDETKLKRWRWTASVCPGLLDGLVTLEPKSHSLTATFMSEAYATFYVAAYYVIDGKQFVDYITININ